MTPHFSWRGVQALSWEQWTFGPIWSISLEDSSKFLTCRWYFFLVPNILKAFSIFSLFHCLFWWTSTKETCLPVLTTALCSEVKKVLYHSHLFIAKTTIKDYEILATIYWAHVLKIMLVCYIHFFQVILTNNSKTGVTALPLSLFLSLTL